MILAGVIILIAGSGLCVDLGWTGAGKGLGKEKFVPAVVVSEKLDKPNTPTGLGRGALGTSYSYQTGGATSNLGHTVEYRFNWGDGNYSAWGMATSASHIWTMASSYPVKAEARCQAHTTVTAVSADWSVDIVSEAVTFSDTPTGSSGGVVGTVHTYQTGGVTNNLGHTVEYRFNWGDGSYSTWSMATSASHAWTTAGSYLVKAEARCQTDTTVMAVSVGLTVGSYSTNNMVLIPAGVFNMGATCFSDAPIHVVQLDAYYIDKHEVTFTQYDAFCLATGRSQSSDFGYGRNNRPVINIEWNDAKAFCDWAGKRLPTEAEWERACRAGTDTAFYWGDDPGYTQMGSYAWYLSNSSFKTQPVGGKLANAFGLYDMSGNVWEWVADWYDSGYYSVSSLNNPTGPTSGSNHVLRGGSWDLSIVSIYGYGDGLRSGYRSINNPGPGGYGGIGCRCAGTP